MGSLRYKGYQVEVETEPTDSGLWLSTAKIQYGSEQISFTVRPYAHGGYTSKGQAEEKTIKMAKDWIDGRT